MENESRAALEALVVDNDDLEELELLLGEFNIFEAIGAVRHELRHSDFLGFLLDPRSNHGLGDEFARLLLQKALTFDVDKQLPISLIDLDVWNLTEIEVYREWQNIDLLLVDKVHRLTVIIENKIGTSEHSNQLQRYRQIVDQQYPGWNIIPIFLTPDGDIPSDESYIPLSYSTVCKVLEGLTKKRTSTMGEDVRTLITHYTQMLRRHIVSESEIADLCQRIYKKHKLAFDLILEHRPNEQAQVIEIVKNLITIEPSLNLDTAAKTLVRFAPKEWYVPSLTQGQGWTPSGQMLLFEIYHRGDSLTVVLYLGPGPEEIRQSLFSMAQANVPPFRTQSKSLNQKWNSIFRKKLLQGKDYDDANLEELKIKLEKVWNEFIGNDLPKIMNVVHETHISLPTTGL